MVRLALDDLVGAKQLLQQDPARQLVRECRGSEGQPPVRPGKDRRGEPERPSDAEPQLAALVAALLDPGRQLLAGERLAAAFQNTQKGLLRYAFEDRIGLGGYRA